jgi:hypothetical protein
MFYFVVSHAVEYQIKFCVVELYTNAYPWWFWSLPLLSENAINQYQYFNYSVGFIFQTGNDGT